LNGVFYFVFKAPIFQIYSMRKLVFLSFVSLLSFRAFSQLKIGNNPTTINSNSILELESTNKGLLIPRVVLQSSNSASPLSAFVAGMLVYNTANSGDVTPGFYVSNGSSWIKIDNQAGTTYAGSTSVNLNGTSFERAALTGDVTAPSNSNATTIANNAVTYGKIQNISTNNRLLGRATTGTGIVEEITLGTGLTITGTTLNAATATTLYSADGTLAGNRTVTQGANTLAFTSSATNGFSVDGSTFSVDAANNRVGIGNSTPISTLSVSGRGVFGSNLTTNNDTNDDIYIEKNGDYSQMHLFNTDLLNTDINAYISLNRTNAGNGSNNLNPGLNIWTSSSHPIRFSTTAAERMVITNAGNVGIGTNSPSMVLNVKSTTADAIKVENSGSATSTAGASSISMINNNSTVGNYTSITSRTSSNGFASAIEFINASHSAPTGDIRFVLNNAGTYGERLRITGAGNVGIGNATPTEKLDVTGNVRFSGAIMPNNLPGTSGQVLTSAGAGAAPTWSTPSSAVNIYNSDGSLTGNRTVNQGANNLTFSGSGTFRINGSSAAQSFSMGGAGIFGIDASGIVNGRFSVLENGNVGIGVASPSQKLDVDGGILARGNNAVSNQGAYLQWNRSGAEGETYILNQKGLAGSNAGIRFGSVTTGNTHTEWARFVDNGSFSVDGSTFSVDASNNRVGIGTSSPQRNFDIAGTNASMAVVAGENESATIGLGTNNSSNISGAVKTAIIAEGINSWSRAKLHFALNDNGSSNSSTESATVANARMTIQSDGKVGIGTTSPGATLNIIHPTANSTPTKPTGNWAAIIENNQDASDSRNGLSVVTRWGAVDSKIFEVASYWNGSSQVYTPVLTVLGNRNVGIGTASPSEKLDVSGNIRFSGAIMPNNLPGTSGQVLTSAGAGAAPTWSTPSNAVNIYNSDGTLTGNRTVTQGANTLTFTSSTTNGFSVDGSTFSVDASNNRVGIGTTTPRGALDVAGTTGWTYLQNSSYGIGNPTIARGLMYAWNNTGGNGEHELLFGTGEGSAPSFNISTWNGTTKTPRLVITKDGDFNLDGSTLSIDATNDRVGVGTSSPTQKLDIDGGILARGNNAVSNQGAYLQWNRSGAEGETYILNQKGGGGSNAGIRFGSVTTGNTHTEWARFVDNGSFSVDGSTLTVDAPNNRIGIGTSSPNSSSIVEMASTTQGFLPPRLTSAQRDAISSPAAGLVIYNTTTNCLNFYAGNAWFETCGAVVPTAVVSSLNCGSSTVTGYIYSGTLASGVSISVPYSGGNGGIYSPQSISSTGVLGLTASLSIGNLVSGSGSLVFTISGTPAASGTATFLLSMAGQSCSFSLSTIPYTPGSVFCSGGPAAVVDVTNPTTGKTWMDRNLGATQKATSSTDANSYGDLYQGGRRSDGHQCRNSTTTSTQSSSDVPPHGNFITSSATSDWHAQNDNLWQGVNGINNPCPTGYRLPTEAELTSERASWASSTSDGAFASPLRWSLAGYRSPSTGNISNVGTNGFYASSTVWYEYFRDLQFGTANSTIGTYNRASGHSVRCIKN
jgi:hypothetical protein